MLPKISELTNNESLFKDTNWGFQYWGELGLNWRDTLEIVDARDAFEKAYDLEMKQPIVWDGAFKKIKHIEVYRPYKETGVPSYVCAVSIKGDIASLPGFSKTDPLYNKQHSSFVAVKSTEQELYDLILRADRSLAGNNDLL